MQSENSIYNKKTHGMDKFLYGCIYLSAAIAVSVLLMIICYVAVRGIGSVSLEFLTTVTSARKGTVGIAGNIVNTLYIIVITLVIATPIGVGSAIYLNEYAKPGKLVSIIEFTTETLSGIPSIIYGLFGMLFFVTALKWGYSMMAGAATLAIMVLPVIMRTTEEALLCVPDSFREGSFGLGAGKLRTIFKIVLPSAIPGILSGIILAIGRIVGETAALIYTSGTVANLAGFFDSGRTLAIHMYSLSREGMHTNEAYATAVVLLVVVLIINGVSSLIAKKFEAPKQ